MKCIKPLLYCVLFPILASCGSSDPTDDSGSLNHVSVALNPFNDAEKVYKKITGQTNLSIEKMAYFEVSINDDHSDSLLVFGGLKDDKLWLEGYHGDYKDWIGDLDQIVYRDKTCNVTKRISWIDSEVIPNGIKEFRYREGTDIAIDTLSHVLPMRLFVSGNDSICIYSLFYANNDGIKRSFYLVKFIPSCKNLPEVIQEDLIQSVYKWSTNYIIIGWYKYAESTRVEECYSMDGQLQYTVNFPKNGNGQGISNCIGISRECGISKTLPAKYNLQAGCVEWEITEQQIAEKLGLALSGKDKIEATFSSKQSDSIWIYTVKVLYEDLYRGDDTYEIKVDINQGKLI